jgi:hypothetical protein
VQGHRCPPLLKEKKEKKEKEIEVRGVLTKS